MRKIYIICLINMLSFTYSNSQQVLVFHTIQTDSNGLLIPWYNPDPAVAYDHDLQLIWNFWQNIPTSLGTKFYMMDHSYSPTLQGNMVGGDQFGMALSSWSLLYAYTGDTTAIENMAYIANTYFSNSLSHTSDAWPNLPYPSNFSNPTLPVYDGDYLLGPGYTQPDKAGSIGNELVTLFKITGDSTYLNYAINIANTLANKVAPGDSANSPYPFKVNAQTGALPTLFAGANFTADFVPTLSLFESLSAMGQGNTPPYDSAYNTIKAWVQKYPQHNNNWGCFFEDIVGPSNTETNAVNMARYILNHANWDSTYIQDARSILDWTFATFADTDWNQYGATAIYEQTADLKPGGSHTSRYASTELIYAEKSGDSSRVAEAIRELNWATYLVDTSGQVRFSPSESSVWYTDGYGDYVRHFLRAMGAYPQIAPANANHLLKTTSVVTHIQYQAYEIDYSVYDSSSYETLRLTSKPLQVLVDGAQISEAGNLNAQGWVWIAYSTGGVLKVYHTNGHTVKILFAPQSINSIAGNEIEAELFPNPANTNVSLHYSLQKDQEVVITVYSFTGQVLNQYNTRAQSGANAQLLNINNLSAGIYFVNLATQEGNCVKKLVITEK